MAIKKNIFKVLVFLGILINNSCISKDEHENRKKELALIGTSPLCYKLIPPHKTSSVSVEEALIKRRTHRKYVNLKIQAEDVSQLLWSAYGITEPKWGLRTTPSAGAVYPLNIYLLVNNVKDINNGVYKYNPLDSTITRIIDRDIKKELASAALNEEMISDAPACILISAVFNKMIKRYGEERSPRYIYMEAGHAAQNFYLQAEALHLGTCSIGAFNDKEVMGLFNMQGSEEPLYIMPIGKYFK
jgi:SagB-type dehydrogenase family enzyme